MVPPMHSHAFSNAMELMATRSDLRAEMAEAGRKRVQTRYVHEDMVENYNRNYEEVAGRWRA